MMQKQPLLVALLIGSFYCAGCDEPAPPPVAAPKAPPKLVAKKVEYKKSTQPLRHSAPSATELAALDRSYQATQQTRFDTGKRESVAVVQATRAIDASLEIGPTLAIWLIDRTPSAQSLALEATSAATSYYESPTVQAFGQGTDAKLLTVVAALDEKLEVLTDPPTANLSALKTAFNSAVQNGSSKENTFSAIQQLLEKYRDARLKDQREVLLFVVTDEAGDDQVKADAAVDLAKKLTIPVYVIGSPAPWGQTNPALAASKMPVSEDTAEQFPIFGPETRQSERVDVSNWRVGGGYRGDSDLAAIDSGFGPFALERLCRASNGKFFAVRPEGSGYGGFSSNGSWPTAAATTFDSDVLKRYTPDYVSEEQYQKLLSENKARKALVEAAKMPPLMVSGSPQSRFRKGDEAAMVRNLNTAQQFAAKNSPPIDRMYEVLAQGEGDREKLTSPRWQAEYDLAMGRVLSVKVRIDGYNAMIAALKRGKTFKKEGSSEWVLEPADTYETGSAIQKMGDKSKMYLQRVVDQHPGTPWAKIAEDELRNNLGWIWNEI